MADDTLRYAIAGLSELADLYTKSKALDIAQQQFVIQQEESVADRALKTRQIDISEKKIESNEALAQLQLFISERDRLYNEQRAQEQVLQKRYNVSPEYKTDAFEDIKGMLTGSMDDNIGVVNTQIGGIQSNLTDLSRQLGALQAQEQWFTAEKSKYVGINKVLQEHEFTTMIDAAKQLDQFKGQDLAGVRTAYAEEMQPWRRTMLAEGMTTKLKSGYDKSATDQYSALQTFTSSEGFDWKGQFGSEEMGDAAKSALSVTDYKAFLGRLNMPGNEGLRNIFEKSPAFGPQLSNIEANAAQVYSLDAELIGETPSRGSVRNNVVDDFTAIMSISDLAATDKSTLFEAYNNFVNSRGITDRKSLDQMFSLLEDRYGEDLEADFSSWLTDPEGFVPSDKPTSGSGTLTEVGSLDQLIAEFETAEGEKKQIKVEEMSKKDWERSADSKFWKMYTRSPSNLKSVFDDIYSPSKDIGVDYPGGGMPEMRDKGVGKKQLSKAEWKGLDDHVARTVSAMLMQPSPTAEDYAFYVGGSLLTADMGDTLLKGRKAAKDLLENYAEYKVHMGDEFQFSPAVKKLMEKYSVKTPAPVKRVSAKRKKDEPITSPFPKAADDFGFGETYTMDPALIDETLDRITFETPTLADVGAISSTRVYSADDLPYDRNTMNIYEVPDWYDFWQKETAGEGFPLEQREGVVEAWNTMGWGRNPFLEE